MILVTGATGTLGTRLVPLLREQNLPLRVLTRDPARAAALHGSGVEIVAGDVRDPRAVARAVEGIGTVIAAFHGFAGRGDENPRTVDWQGNRILIRAAREAGVERYILVSVHGAAPDHPMELMRMKWRAEEELRASGVAWTIVRPTAYMETWARLIGAPLLASGRTRVFGRGNNPVNFVAADDVAGVVAQAVTDPALRGRVVEVCGPENLSLRQVAATFATVSGRPGRVGAVPLPVMRVLARLLRPFHPALARQIQAGVVMDTTAMAVDVADAEGAAATRLADVVRRADVEGGGAEMEHPSTAPAR